MSGRIRKRDLTFLVTGALIAAMFISPAGAHVGGSVAHLWKKHIKPKITELVYTEAEADALFLDSNDKAANSDALDGKDSSDFAPAEAEAWHELGAPGEPQLNDGSYWGSENQCRWENVDAEHNSAAFAKDSSGWVHLKGLVQAHDGPDPMYDICYAPGPERHFDNYIFVLPPGYRPARRVVLSTMANAKPMRVNVDSDGVVSIGSESAFDGNYFEDARQWLSLDGLTFRAEQ